MTRTTETREIYWRVSNDHAIDCKQSSTHWSCHWGEFMLGKNDIVLLGNGVNMFITVGFWGVYIGPGQIKFMI